MGKQAEKVNPNRSQAQKARWERERLRVNGHVLTEAPKQADIQVNGFRISYPNVGENSAIAAVLVKDILAYPVRG